MSDIRGKRQALFFPFFQIRNLIVCPGVWGGENLFFIWEDPGGARGLFFFGLFLKFKKIFYFFWKAVELFFSFGFFFLVLEGSPVFTKTVK